MLSYGANVTLYYSKTQKWVYIEFDVNSGAKLQLSAIASHPCLPEYWQNNFW
jgi:hypothetical protein